MHKHWNERLLGEVADFINGDRGKNYPSPLDRVDSGLPFINTGHIEPTGWLSHDRMDFITRERYEKLGSGKVKKGDIVYCLRGSTIGKTARNRYEEGAIASSLIIIRAKANVCQDFLYYFLISPGGQRLAKSNDNGSAQPNLSGRVLSRYPLILPPLPEQKAIAHILGTLDDKIELNRKMNETLEQMAQALFKSWFVDFDPVIDKALAAGNPIPEPLQKRAKLREELGDQRKPLPAHIAVQFPDSFTITEELGWIPEGWEVKQLGDICKLKNGFAFKSKDWQEIGVPVVKIGSVKPIIVDTSKSSYVSNEIAQSVSDYQLERGDILIGLTGYVGEVGRIIQQVNMPLLNQRVAKFQPNQSYYSFCYSCTRSSDFKDYAERRASGSAQPNVSTKALLEYILATPKKESLIAEFGELSASLLDAILSNSEQNIKLTQIRDTLLPKLISGELRVPYAENLIAEHA